ncbi:hypothetical protein [uncultured Nocardioides sp.]|uniref:hypothetical protein n=1 Tax=uncultured Nocardioides sp. TaxID=198441 RepID=UPI0026185719|nr:hypothetical protein [uncultured Nocardioides sp.]
MHPAAGEVDHTPHAPRRSARHRLVLTGLLATLALVVSACSDADDGSADEPTAAETWASDVCSTVGAWTTTVEDARTTLSTPRDLSVDELEATVTEVSDATSTLVDDLGGLGTPDTESGDEAEQRIASLSEQLQEQAAVVEDGSGGEPQGMEELLTRVSTVTGAVAQMISDTQAAVADLRTLDGAQELEDAFSSAASCEDLRS